MKSSFLLRSGAAVLGALAAFVLSNPALAQDAEHRGGEANLKLPSLSGITLAGIEVTHLLWAGVGVCVVGFLFGMAILASLRKQPVHKSMLEISELIYETCKTYLVTQGKLILLLQLFVGAIMIAYFGFLQEMEPLKVAVILLFSLIGIAGSYGVAWFGIRVNTLANSRAAFASLRGTALPVHSIPLQAGMSIGMLLISIELGLMLLILLLVPGDYAGPCFIGFAIGESLGASALRIAGGIFTKIADIGADLMKIVFGIKEDDARNPGVIADCTGDNAGDSIGPSADAFETYGVTGVALISFVILAVEESLQIQLLAWIFSMSVMTVIASGISYLINAAISRSRYAGKSSMNFEQPLTVLVWVTAIVSVALIYLGSFFLIRDLGDGTLWWRLASILSCGALAGALIPELVKVFTSTNSGHVREVVTSSKEGGPSLNILSGLVAGNFSGYWLGFAIMGLMGLAWWIMGGALDGMMVSGLSIAAPVFAFGLVAFGFLAMGPVTIAVDGCGPVTDNAQSVFELSVIESLPGIDGEIEKSYGFKPDFPTAKALLEENDGAGNTFKATAKPVLIGTAVVGAATMIFSIIMMLTEGLQAELLQNLTILNPPFLFGLIAGGAVIYWFTGASTQAVTTGAYRAVEFIKGNIKLDGVTKASTEDSKKVVEICTLYAQKGMLNIFFALFFSTLAFAFADAYFFIGYLISMAIFGLFQAIFMANAGGAWDNAKKVVETELNAKGTDLHAASVVGDTVGDPFKDTSSVAMNPVIKFTTLFGLLAVELAVMLDTTITSIAAIGCFAVSVVFVWRSFYGMRIKSGAPAAEQAPAAAAAD
ncbi:MAG TPA: sodium-translocating pyrophosphatase [Burkholderiales bacterium]|nr:sodium-translocating pyrophosphatase [Burkholderiales bacterium]